MCIGDSVSILSYTAGLVLYQLRSKSCSDSVETFPLYDVVCITFGLSDCDLRNQYMHNSMCTVYRSWYLTNSATSSSISVRGESLVKAL